MTAQVSDQFTYKGADFTLAAMSPSGKKLFDPHDYGLKPMGIYSSCWDGYWCEFDISDALYLEKLYIHCEDLRYPDICGRKVSMPVDESLDPEAKEFFEELWKSNMDHMKYENMHLLIPFTGKLMAGADFLWEYYIHMGYQRAYAYKKLYEFEFIGGSLVRTTDLSSKAAGMREKIKKLGLESIESRNDLIGFIDRSFSLDYDDKGFPEDE